AVLMPAELLELAGSHELPGAVADAFAGGVPASAAVLEGCARERRVLAAPAAAEDMRFGAEWQSLAAEAGFASLLAIPVEAPRTGAGGLVVVFFTDPRQFVDDDLELARQLASAARGALERSELFEQERTSRAL